MKEKLFENVEGNQFRAISEDMMDPPLPPKSGGEESHTPNPELYNYMVKVAKANGFDSITDAITYAVRSKKVLSSISKIMKEFRV